jgi:hypothetical protein
MLKYSYFKHRLREKINLRKLIRKGKIGGDIEIFFIISAGRSGSTLLRKHLQEKSDIYIPPESEDFIPKLVNLFAKHIHDYDNFITETVHLIQKMDCLRVWKLEKNNIVSLLHSIPNEDRKIDIIIYALYFSQVPQDMNKRVLIGDKTPLLNDYLYLLSEVFPKGKLIYMVRDGRAVVNSYVQSRSYSVERALARWKSSIRNFENKKHLFSKRLVLLKYEDFISSPDQKIEEILNMLGVKRNFQSLEKEIVDMGDTHLSHHANVQNPINSDSMEKWRLELSIETINKLNELMANELDTYQYKK